MNVQDKLALIKSVYTNGDDNTKPVNASSNIAKALASIHLNDGKVDIVALETLKLVEGQLACIGAILDMPEVSPV